MADDWAALHAPHLAEVEEEEATVPLKPTPLEEVLETGKEGVALMKQSEPSSWVCDGGGNHSTGDWSSVPSEASSLRDPLGTVRQELKNIIRDNDLDKAPTANIAVKAREPPWSADITEQAQEILLKHLRPQTCSAAERTQLLKVEEEQPLRLHLLEAVASSIQDKDVAIWPQLAERVHTGCILGRPIADAGVFPKRVGERANPEKIPSFEVCQDNWQSAEVEPLVTKALVQKEEAEGWVREFRIDTPGGSRPGTIEDARAMWPEGVAKGKLDVVRVEGKDDPQA